MSKQNHKHEQKNEKQFKEKTESSFSDKNEKKQNYKDKILNVSNDDFRKYQSSSLELVNADDKLNKIVNLFNQNPSKAIPFLCKYYKFTGRISAPVIAHIIHTTPGLKNDKILMYFFSSSNTSQNSKKNSEKVSSDRKSFNFENIQPLAVLKAFFDEMNLKVSLLDAMRTCLDATNFLNCSFKNIDYILQTFSYSFYDQNKSAIKVSYIYLAALSIILLNNEILKSRLDDDKINFENTKKMIPEYYDLIIKHIFPEHYLQFFSSGAVFRRINAKPFSQKIFNAEDIKIHFTCHVEKKTNKWNSVFKRRILSLNNNRIILYKKKIPTSLLLINSNLIIQTEHNHSKKTFIRSSSFIYKNQKKIDLFDYESYTSLTKSAQKQYKNGIIQDFSHISDISLLNNNNNRDSMNPYSSSSYDFSCESEKGESLLYAHFGKNSSFYKKNIDELILSFDSIDDCKNCLFVLKKALLISFFIEDSPPLTIPPAFLEC